MYKLTANLTSVCFAGGVIFMVLVIAIILWLVWKKRKWLLFYVVGIMLILAAFFYLGSSLLEYREGEAEYDALQEQVFAGIEGDEAEEDTTSETEGIEQMNGESYEETEGAEKPQDRAELDRQVMQAISDLKEINPDVIGWITFDNMELSYPIMQGEDNDYYLNHTFSGEVNSAGSIFMEALNTPDFEDCHTIIYGHNMKNLSMFGQLKNYKTKDFYEEHPYFTIYTESKVCRYQIFAYYDVAETDDVYSIGFSPNEQFKAFVDEMIQRSYYDTDVEVTEQDKVITLSTCSDEGNRFVVNAKRIESGSEYE